MWLENEVWLCEVVVSFRLALRVFLRLSPTKTNTFKFQFDLGVVDEEPLLAGVSNKFPFISLSLL